MNRKQKLVFLALSLVGLVLAGTTAVVVYNMTRGLRNNNPGNIRKSATAWQGLAPQQTDSAFFQFTDPLYGIRAMAHILTSYAARGVTTLQDIIHTWAPPTENDTAAYVRAVAADTGLDPSATITVNEYPALLAAIIHHENGQQPYPMATIAQAVAMG